MTKKLLFTISIKDCEVQTFCTGGNGGQHKNAKQNGVRVIHPPSGARAEHRDGRDQAANKTEAFIKMANTKAFKAWHRLESARRMGQPSPEQVVEQAMARPQDFKIEVKDEAGKWVHGTADYGGLDA